MEFIATIVFIVFAFGLQLYKEAKVYLAEKERSRLLSLGAQYLANEYLEKKKRKVSMPPNIFGINKKRNHDKRK